MKIEKGKLEKNDDVLRHVVGGGQAGSGIKQCFGRKGRRHSPSVVPSGKSLLGNGFREHSQSHSGGG